MPFGGFCPLPLRLGGSKEEGWTPEQHARMAADCLGMTRSVPFARVCAWVGVAVPPLSYASQPVSGVAAAPTATDLGPGVSRFDWPASVADDMGVFAPVSIRQARVSSRHTMGNAEAATFVINSPTSITVYAWRCVAGVWGAADGMVDLVVY